MVYRIFHATDLHFHVRPTLQELLTEPKRLLGCVNLYLLGRRRAFSSGDVQRQLVQAAIRHQPSHVILTGDLTSLATAAEFEAAAACLQPLLPHAAFRTLVLPGNHDVYTRSAQRLGLFDRHFGRFSLPYGRLSPLAPGLAAVALDPCRANLLSSRGHYPADQLKQLTAALQSPALQSSFLLLLTHYPVLDRHGRDYSLAHPNHAADNNAELMAVLRRGLSRALSAAEGGAALLLHGHVHDGYSVDFLLPQAEPDAPGLSFPCHNPGAGGRSAAAGKGRAAAYNLYTITRLQQQQPASASSSSPVTTGWSLQVDRFVHNGSSFQKQSRPYAAD